jgi:hypothetical protein
MLALATFVTAAPGPPAQAASMVQPIAAAFSSIFPQGSSLTPQILQTLLESNEVNLARNSHVYREGTTLRLLGDQYTASGANVYVSIPSLCLASQFLQYWASRTVFQLPCFLIFEQTHLLIP